MINRHPRIAHGFSRQTLLLVVLTAIVAHAWNPGLPDLLLGDELQGQPRRLQSGRGADETQDDPARPTSVAAPDRSPGVAVENSLRETPGEPLQEPAGRTSAVGNSQSSTADRSDAPTTNPATNPADRSAETSAESPIEIFRGSSRQSSGMQRGTSVADAREMARQLNHVDEIAANLELRSTEAFDRGLMSLHNYFDHQQIALTLATRSASLRNDRSMQHRNLVRHAARMHRIAEELAQFNQPASRGWAADLAEARMLAVMAETNAATFLVDERLSPIAEQAIATLAEQQFRLRLEDYRVGLASLPELSRAASFLQGAVVLQASSNTARDFVLPVSIVDYQQVLKNVVRTTERLAAHQAGLGRDDRVELARAELLLSNAHRAFAQDNEIEFVNQLRSSLESAHRLFAMQRTYYRSGTANLFDLAHSWMYQKQLHLAARDAGFRFSNTITTQTDADLQTLVQLAENTTDTRGRSAADILLVKGLQVLESLDSNTASVKSDMTRQVAANSRLRTARVRNSTMRESVRNENQRQDGRTLEEQRSATPPARKGVLDFMTPVIPPWKSEPANEAPQPPPLPFDLPSKP